MIKHATASTFVMHHDFARGWYTGLVWHPIFQVWVQPGGHVEMEENAYEAAWREAFEETGLSQLRMVSPSTDIPAVDSATDPQVPHSWWIIEHTVETDNHLSQRHVHVDHKYVAMADEPVPAEDSAHRFQWHRVDDLATLTTFDDVKHLARTIAAALEEESAMTDSTTLQPTHGKFSQ